MDNKTVINELRSQAIKANEMARLMRATGENLRAADYEYLREIFDYAADELTRQKVGS